MNDQEFLGRDAFLAPTPRRYKTVSLPGGRRVRIRSMTEAEKAEFEDALTDRNGKPIASRVLAVRRRLIAWCMVDGEGRRVLSDEDVNSEAFRSLDAALTSALFRECREFCGFDDDDFSALEAEVKNSETTHDD